MLQLALGELLDVDEAIRRALDSRDELAQLQLHGPHLPVLGVLDHEHHQEGDDGRARVDDELPPVGKMEYGTQGQPGENDEERHSECPEAPGGDARRGGKSCELVFDCFSYLHEAFPFRCVAKRPNHDESMATLPYTRDPSCAESQAHHGSATLRHASSVRSFEATLGPTDRMRSLRPRSFCGGASSGRSRPRKAAVARQP